MADQVLEKANLYFDELNKLKLLKPQYSQASSDLLEKIQLLISKNSDLETFKKDVELKFVELCRLLEEQRLKAAAARSVVTNYNVQRKRKHELLRSKIARKQSILEKLTIEIKTLEEEEERQRAAILKLTEDSNFESV